MPVDLDSALAWTAADADNRAMLSDLQGNILKGHGRRATLNMFISLSKDVDLARLTIRRLGALTDNALDQLRNAETYKRLKKRGGVPTGASPTFFTVMLSHAGYAKLGRTDIVPTNRGAFIAGMGARADQLNDRIDRVDPEWEAQSDVLVIIGDDPDGPDAWTSKGVEAGELLVTSIVVPLGARITHKEAGRAIFRTQPDKKRTEGIEHFGYVDGRSQPLMLQEQVAEEARGHGGTTIWSPEFPLKQVLVSDPGSADGVGYGSFFVFRKLEQDVVGFKAAEKALQTLKDSQGRELGEVAGAMLVGRFEDGTPVTTNCRSLEDRVKQDGEKADVPVPNDFDFSADMNGVRCPFYAHIRKTNPREDTVRLAAGGDTADARGRERSHIMARRGITYGRRDTPLDPSESDFRHGPVGLLFMAYQSDIENQFEFTQKSWANDPRFAPGRFGGTNPGRDPIIGQRGHEAGIALDVRLGCDDPDAEVACRPFEEYVIFRGGDYFFAPARSTLMGM